MNTEVIIKRPLLGGEISQKSKSEFLSATDLMKVANCWRAKNGMIPNALDQYFKLDSSKEFIQLLTEKYGIIKNGERGRGKHTWVHPILFIDISLWLNPRLKLEVYEWLYDNLLKYRNNSGDSYKKMVGSVALLTTNKSLLQRNIMNTTNKIKDSLEVKEWNIASESKLEIRDNIHNNISLLSNVLRDLDQVVDLAIKQGKGEI